MPAGDVGLEMGPETACRAYPVEAEEALNAWMASKALDKIWVSPAGWWYAAWMHRQPDVDHLRAQLAAQQAVVDAARAFDAVLSHYCDGPERDQLRAALDKAQTAQLEGERETINERTNDD